MFPETPGAGVGAMDERSGAPFGAAGTSRDLVAFVSGTAHRIFLSGPLRPKKGGRYAAARSRIPFVWRHRGAGAHVGTAMPRRTAGRAEISSNQRRTEG